MKIKILSLAGLVSVLGGASLLAVTCSQSASAPSVSPNLFQAVGFGNSAEAGMMHRAYHILATGDHDYKGHRLAAMRQVHKAADFLGLDLHGDYDGKERQVLSDDKLREARGLLQQVLGAAEVKNQERIARHIQAAINEINRALEIR